MVLGLSTSDNLCRDNLWGGGMGGGGVGRRGRKGEVWEGEGGRRCGKEMEEGGGMGRRGRGSYYHKARLQITNMICRLHKWDVEELQQCT